MSAPDRLSESGSGTWKRSHTFHLANTLPLYIGFRAQGSFNGAMTDLRLYTGALSDVGVKVLHTGRGR